jgi:hypothetical protein
MQVQQGRCTLCAVALWASSRLGSLSEQQQALRAHTVQTGGER